MDYTFYLYPGNNISVSVAAKVVVTALAPGEVPPAGRGNYTAAHAASGTSSPSDNGTTGERE